MGIGGADLVIAVIAAGLRPYMAYAAVEKPNGELLSPEEYLRQVEHEVADAVLQRVMGIDQAGLGNVDQQTQFYVIGRFEFGGAYAPWDEFNTLARATGVELRELIDSAAPLLSFGSKRSEVKLEDFRERGQSIEHGRSTIDHLQRILWLAENEPVGVREYLEIARPDAERLRLVARALSRPGLDATGARGAEADACERLLGVWRRLVDDNLFTRA
jgi:putative DNA methylase